MRICIFLIHALALLHDAIDRTYTFPLRLVVGLGCVLSLDGAFGCARGFAACVGIVRKHGVDFPGTFGVELVPELREDVLRGFVLGFSWRAAPGA